MIRDATVFLLLAGYVVFGEIEGCGLRGHVDGKGRSDVVYPWQDRTDVPEPLAAPEAEPGTATP